MEYMLDTLRKQEFVTELRQRLESLESLPALPETALSLIYLRHNSDAGVDELTATISQDASISLQIVRYARMANFGYGDRIKNVSDAIQLVLGYNRALHMAMGLSAAQTLKMPVDGPIGLDRYWEHSLHTAVLTQCLASEVQGDIQVDVGVAYLAGLLHDIGFMLLGHLYPMEFRMLSNLIDRCSDRDVRELEFQCLGISHDLIGLCLLRAWEMPGEVVVAAGEHHFPDYGGEHALYAKLVFLANMLLTQENIGFGSSGYSSFSLNCEELGLGEAELQSALANMRNLSPELHSMAEEMAA